MNQIELRKRIANELRTLRKSKKLSQGKVADMIGVHINTIHRLESEAASDFGLIGHIIPLCEVYEIKPHWFIMGIMDTESNNSTLDARGALKSKSDRV